MVRGEQGGRRSWAGSRGQHPAWVSRPAFLGGFCLRFLPRPPAQTPEGLRSVGWRCGCAGGSLRPGSVSFSPHPLILCLSFLTSGSLPSPCPTTPPTSIYPPSTSEARMSLSGCQGPRPPWLSLPRPCSWAIPEDPTAPGPSLRGGGPLTGCAPDVSCLGWLNGPRPAWEPRTWALLAVREGCPSCQPRRPWMPTAHCGYGLLQATPP